VEGSVKFFWATLATSTPSLAANARGGFFYVFLGDDGHHHSLPTANTSGGFFYIFLGNDGHHHPLPRCKRERGGFSFLSW
jgi:hypothetical protein